ncbi:hypothetical protein D6T64_10095 [Cryobacterium melibiosiphilum]|uniref:LPXTG cell wall anchor domain-containing protein n=1 Tax=Cryobacterium melibiosiphilum TaxID=995039 RepID=A0A3A5MHZ4_9MICO|nr:hypothetical protein [Cryobacterium melibiosiphilum]RJT88481.1 hypothetical protein D6T64_10095 [Cryobacterium melibiosiphilum]
MTTIMPAGAARRAVALASGVALMVGLSLFSVQAQAALRGVPETGAAGMLTLTSDQADPDQIVVVPGVPTYWQIDAALQHDGSGTLNLEMIKSGAMATNANGLTVMVERCNESWTNVPDRPECAANRRTVVVATPLDNLESGSELFDLDGIPARRGKHLLVTLTLGNTGMPAGTLSGRIGFGLTAAGDTAAADTASSPAALAATGMDAAALVLVGLGAVGLGLTVSAMRRARASVVVAARPSPTGDLR